MFSSILQTAPEGSADEAGLEASAVHPGGGQRRLRKKPPRKPAYSHISLICMAITNSPHKQATLKVHKNIVLHIRIRAPSDFCPRYIISHIIKVAYDLRSIYQRDLITHLGKGYSVHESLYAGQ